MYFNLTVKKHMKFSVIEVISLIAIFQSLLMAAFFLSLKKGNRKSNLLFAAILSVFAILISYSFIIQREISLKVFEVAIIVSQSALLIGPLIFLYINSRLDSKFDFTRKDLIHFAPYVLVSFYFIVRFYIYDQSITWESPARVTNNIIILTQNFAYIILVFYNLKSHRIPIKSIMISSQNPRLSWLRIILLGYIAVWSINIQIFVVLDVCNRYGWCPYIFSLYFLILFLLLNTIVFITLKKPSIVMKSKKYETSSLHGPHKKRMQDKLLEHMRIHKPYLDSSCSLSRLSKELSVSSNHLSQLINETYNQNFYDFINEYRIEESKKLLENNGFRKKTILEIAYEVGFNSKTTFNNAFRKYTGVTPREYRSTKTFDS